MKHSIKDKILTLGRSPFFQGLSSIFNIFGDDTPVKIGSFSDDVDAMRSDWRKIGNDMRQAMTIYGKEIGTC